MNPVKLKFTNTQNWTCPAGVTAVNLTVNKKTLFDTRTLIVPNGFVDPYNNLWMWGDNFKGQLGDNTILSKSSPILVAGSLTWKYHLSISSTNAIGASTGGISLAGDAYMWGSNQQGELGNNAVTFTSSPVLVVGGLKWNVLAGMLNAGVGASAILGITAGGDMYGWGYNAGGQLGLNDVTPRSSPVLVVGGLKWKTFCLGNGMVSEQATGVLAVATTNAAYGWGTNALGQLGTGDQVTRSSPTLVVGGLSISKVAKANAHSVFITAANDAYMCGVNNAGELGTNDLIPRSSPTLVVGGLKWSSVIPSASFFGQNGAGLTTTGQLYCWGENSQGQLGVGDIVNRSSPALVLGGLTFRKFAAGPASVMAITETGDMYGFGNNNNGQLGVGDATLRSSPTLVPGGLKWIDVQVAKITRTDNFAGGFIALASNGGVYRWGDAGGAGNIGDGANVNRSSPALVVGGIAPRTGPFTKQVKADVIPGTVYAVQVGQQSVYFGTTLVDNGLYDELLLEYFD